jgi:hypothetical protein
MPAETGTSHEGGMGGMLEMTPGPLPDFGSDEANQAAESSGFSFAFPDDPPAEDTLEQPELPPADVVVSMPDSMLTEPQQPRLAIDESTPPDVPPAPPDVSPDANSPSEADLPELDLEPANEETVAGASASSTAPTLSGFDTRADPPAYNADDLQTALENARQALSPLADTPENSGPGGEGESQSPDLTEAGFQRLCGLGEILASVGEDKAMVERKSAVEDLVRSVGESPSNIREIARLGNERLNDPDRQSTGILLAGKVEDVRSAQEIHSARIKLASVEQRVALVSPTPLALQSGDRVLVLGSLLAEQSADNLPIHHAADNARQVIWCGLCLKF